MERKLEVLVVDDDPSVLLSLTRILERSGCNVTPVEFCAQGIELFQKEPNYDLVFTDLNQRPSGVDLIDAIRVVNGEVPIYVVTGGAPEDLKKAARDKIGEEHLIWKPVRAQVIQNVVYNVTTPTISLFHRDSDLLGLYRNELVGSGYFVVTHQVNADTQPGWVVEQVIKDNAGLVFLAVNYNTGPPKHQEGFEAMAALKNDEVATKYVPVVVVSADPQRYADILALYKARGCLEVDPHKPDNVVEVAKRYLPVKPIQS